MGLAWGIGYFLTQNLFEKNNLDQNELRNFSIGMFIFSWVGAKLFFLWFSSGPKIYQYIYANYFWLGGGFVFYGGLVFGLIFYLIWSVGLKKFNQQNTPFLVPGIALGHGVGRIGCLLAGCCFGKETNSFLHVVIDGHSRIPVQLYEAIGLFIIGNFSLNLIRKNRMALVIPFYLFTYSNLRFVLEFYRGDEIRGIFWFNLSSSQLVSIFIFFVAIGFYFKNKNSLN